MFIIPTDEFLGEDEFAQKVTVNNSAIINGIFQEPGAIVTPGGVEIITTEPTLMCASSDVKNLSAGDILTPELVGTTYYLIKSPDADGYGFSTLYLSKDKVN